MKIKALRDFWSGLLFLLVGIAFAWLSTGDDFGSATEPGPAFFPFGLGLLLAILGGFVLFKALAIEADGSDPVGSVAWRPLVFITGALVFFACALPQLGLLCTLPWVVVLSTMAGEQFRWRVALLNSGLLTLGAWAIFVWWLKLEIPVWPTLLHV